MVTLTTPLSSRLTLVIDEWCVNQWPLSYGATWDYSLPQIKFLNGQDQGYYVVKTWFFLYEHDAALFKLTWS